MITKNFSESELAGIGETWSNIPKSQQANLTFLTKNILQPARDLLNESIIISSSYRSSKHNQAVGGASQSQHVLGKAVDIYVHSKTGLELFEFFIKNFGDKIGGIGLYYDEKAKAKFIHIDTRAKQNKNTIVSWYYDGRNYLSPTTYMKNLAKKYKYNLIG